MFLSDADIMREFEAGRLVVDPFNSAMLRPASICLRLGRERMEIAPADVVDPTDSHTYPDAKVVEIGDEGYVMPNGSFLLTNTLERIAVDRGLCAFVVCVSGLQRLGLDLATSLVSPGFGETAPSTLTLELRNHSGAGVRLHPGMRVAHIVFAPLATHSEAGYDANVGLYSNQDSPRTSRFHMNSGVTLDSVLESDD